MSTTGSSKRPPAIRSAARSSRRIRFACTDAAQIADDDGEEQADQAREQQPALDQLQARDRIGERVAEQDHDALVLERNRHLGEAPAPPLDGAALEPRACASHAAQSDSRATSSDEVVFESPKMNGWFCRIE